MKEKFLLSSQDHHVSQGRCRLDDLGQAEILRERRVRIHGTDDMSVPIDGADRLCRNTLSLARSHARTHARSHGRRCGLLVRQVIKTRMMALDRSSTASSPTSTAVGLPRRATVLSTAREVVHASGYRGLYKGFSTVVCGLIPGRMMYLTVGVDLSPAGLLARRIVSIIAAAHAPTASSPSHHHRRHHRAIPLVR